MEVKCAALNYNISGHILRFPIQCILFLCHSSVFLWDWSLVNNLELLADYCITQDFYSHVKIVYAQELRFTVLNIKKKIYISNRIIYFYFAFTIFGGTSFCLSGWTIWILVCSSLFEKFPSRTNFTRSSYSIFSYKTDFALNKKKSK